MKKIRFIAALLCLFMISVMPAAASGETGLQKVVDQAGLLSDEEVTELSAQIDTLVSQYQVDVVLVTENEKQQADIQAEADMLFDDNGYGIGTDKDGILLAVDMGSGEWGISTHGNAIQLFSDYDLAKMGENAAEQYFSQGRFYEGFRNYLKELGQKLEIKQNQQENKANTDNGILNKDSQASNTPAKTGQTAKAADTAVESKTPRDYIRPALIVGGIITVIFMLCFKSGMKTANKQKNADVYQRKEEPAQIYKKEVFLTSSMTKKQLKQSGNASRTTSTVHRSENGEKHGGASGKF